MYDMILPLPGSRNKVREYVCGQRISITPTTFTQSSLRVADHHIPNVSLATVIIDICSKARTPVFAFTHSWALKATPGDLPRHRILQKETWQILMFVTKSNLTVCLNSRVTSCAPPCRILSFIAFQAGAHVEEAVAVNVGTMSEL